MFSYCSCRPYYTARVRLTIVPTYFCLYWYKMMLPWRFAPWHWKLKEGKKNKNKNRSQAFLKIMKIDVESLYTIQQSSNFSKLWYSLKSSVKAIKPYHCHKLVLNNINKMDIFLRHIQNSVKHLRWRFSQKKIMAEKIHDRCLTGFRIHLFILAIMHWPIPEKHSTIIGKTYYKILFQ